MVWIFALGIVVLCVYSKGFRKFMGAIAGVAVLAGVVVGVIVWKQDSEREAQQAAKAQEFKIRYASCDDKNVASAKTWDYLDCLVEVDKKLGQVK